MLREREGRPSVLGVLSRSTDPANLCGGSNDAMRVDYFLDWIREQVPQAEIVQSSPVETEPPIPARDGTPGGKADGFTEPSSESPSSSQPGAGCAVGSSRGAGPFTAGLLVLALGLAVRRRRSR